MKYKLLNFCYNNFKYEIMIHDEIKLYSEKYLFQAISSKQVQANLQAVALGDSFISPIDSILTWAPYLLNLVSIESRSIYYY